jgi:hypothetical protein
MLQELVTNLSTTLAVASLLFFVVVYIVVAIGAFRADAKELDSRARLVLDDANESAADDGRVKRG